MDYSALIHTIVDPFIQNPSAILIREIKDENPKNLTLLICSENDDIARMIGKKGCVANAIREILAVAGKLENKRIHAKFESFDENRE